MKRPWLFYLIVILAFCMLLTLMLWLMRPQSVNATELAEATTREELSIVKIDSVYEATYGIRIKYNGVLVARKRLWVRAEWMDAEGLVRIIGAASPEVSWDQKFHWQRLEQNIRNTDWGYIWTK